MRWIIGDIHGMLRPLQGVLDLIHRIDPSPRLIFVGDYVNRGPDSRQVIDLLLTLGDAHFLRGNHDDIFDQVLHGESYAPNPTEGDRLAAFSWFMQYGLISTLLSYGADLEELERLDRHPELGGVQAVLERVPAEHRQFVHGLGGVVEEDEFFVGHGKWDPDDFADHPRPSAQLAGDARKRERLLWGRFTDDEIRRTKAWDRVGYFGHTPVDNYPDLLASPEFIPVIGPRIVLLDTAAALSPQGRLTAVCHETQTYHQADRFGKILTLED
jgi:hypothetical protein